MQSRSRLSLVDLLAQPIRIGPEDISALVRRLCLHTVGSTLTPVELVADPLGPEHVWLDSSGNVHVAQGVCLTVRDLGGLLEQLLAEIRRRGVGRIPPGLLITTARATGKIDDAPLVSAGALARALERFDPPDPDAALRALFEVGATAAAEPAETGVTAAAEPAIDELPAANIQIRDRHELAEPVNVTKQTTKRWRVAVAVAGVTGFSGGVMVAVMLQHDSAPRPSDTTEVVIATPRIDPRQSRPVDTASAKPRERAPSILANPPPVRRRLESAAEPLVDPAAADADAAFSPSFDAKGTAIFFHAQSGNSSALKRAERDESGVLHVVTIVNDAAKNYHVQLSPDGTSVAFDSDRDGVRGVYVARANGSDVRRVTGPGYAAVPTWSPDGGRLAFLRAEDDRPRVWNLWVKDLSSGAMTRLTNYSYGQVWGGGWFADGRRIAYSHEDRLVVLDLSSRRSTTYPSPRKGHLVRTPAVSPDGRWIMFQVLRDGAWILDLTTGSMQRTLDDPSAEEFTWAPDGRRVAFHSRRSGEWGLWVMATR